MAARPNSYVEIALPNPYITCNFRIMTTATNNRIISGVEFPPELLNIANNPHGWEDTEWPLAISGWSFRKQNLPALEVQRKHLNAMQEAFGKLINKNITGSRDVFGVEIPITMDLNTSSPWEEERVPLTLRRCNVCNVRHGLKHANVILERARLLETLFDQVYAAYNTPPAINSWSLFRTRQQVDEARRATDKPYDRSPAGLELRVGALETNLQTHLNTPRTSPTRGVFDILKQRVESLNGELSRLREEVAKNTEAICPNVNPRIKLLERTMLSEPDRQVTQNRLAALEQTARDIRKLFSGVIR